MHGVFSWVSSRVIGTAKPSLRGRPSVLWGGGADLQRAGFWRNPPPCPPKSCPLQIRPPIKLRACHAGYAYPNLVPRACDPWEGNEGSGIIRIRHTENCMSTELRMRWQKQNKLFEIFYCFVHKMMIFSEFWWKC